MWIKVFCIGCKWFWYWFGLVWRSIYKKGNVWFSKEMLSTIYQNPCSYFGYRLSYNQPNEVLPIGKNHKRLRYKCIEGTRSKL